MNIVKDYTSDNYIYYNKVERENDPIKVASRSNKLNKNQTIIKWTMRLEFHTRKNQIVYLKL